MTWPLKEFVESACSTDPNRENLHRVRKCDGWVFGSTGHVLVAVPDSGQAAEPMRLPAGVSSGLQASPGGAAFDVDALREWCGPSSEPCPGCDGEQTPQRPCPDCRGKGETSCECIDCGHEHTAPCEGCGGDGTVDGCESCGGLGQVGEDELDRIGSIGDVLFNRRKMARLLALAPSGTVRISATQSHEPVVVVADDWRGLVMPIRGESERVGTPDPIEALAMEPTP